MKAGSLFSGIGAMDRGIEAAGFEIVWQVEIDPFCREILAFRFPHAKRHTSVRRKLLLDPVDLICGGFPCQPVSDAADSPQAHKDSRWLWPEFGRIVAQVRPKWVLIENVEALRRRGLNIVLSDLAKIGYDAEWDVVPAAFLGAPHYRERLFVVAYPKSTRLPRPCIFRKPASLAHAANEGVLGRGRFRYITSGRKVGVLEGTWATRSGWWRFEPDVARVAYGAANRVDRITAIGNGVVPQVSEMLARLILAAEEKLER